MELVQLALRFILICTGAWLAALEPAVRWADARQTVNTASGHIPNMDPGVMANIALLLTIPIVIVLLIVELMRWAWNGKTLALPSYLVLGAVATSPVGYMIGLHENISNVALYTASALLLLGFYSVRWIWIIRRTRSQR